MERLNNMLKVTQLLSGKVRIQAQKFHYKVCVNVLFSKRHGLLVERREVVPCGGQSTGKPRGDIGEIMYVEFPAQDPTCNKCSICFSGDM